MPKPNTVFELSVEDIALIETSLRHAHGSLSMDLLRHTDEKSDEENGRKATQRKIQNLLGRLHDQKIFYRPKDKVYVSG